MAPNGAYDLMAVKTIKELRAILDQARGHTTGSHTMQMRAKEEFVGQGPDILRRLAMPTGPSDLGQAVTLCEIVREACVLSEDDAGANAAADCRDAIKAWKGS